MPKKVIQDMVKPERPRPSLFRASTPEQVEQAGGGRSWALWVLFALFAGAGFWYLSGTFSRAVVRVTPRTEQASIDAVFTAQRGEGDLRFETVSFRARDFTVIPSEKTERVQKKATGILTVYNAFSSSKQQLVEKTRFRASDGKIYRAVEAISVPGATKSASGVLVPGSVDAPVVADEPGSGYNRGPGDFVIPGFEGSPKFEKIYAKLKGEISGGFIGDIAVVPDEAIQRAREELKVSLEKNAIETVQKELPSAFVAYPGGMYLQFTDLSTGAVSAGATSSGYRVEGEVYLRGIIIPKRDLAYIVAKTAISGFDLAPVELEDVSALAMDFSDKEKFDYDNGTTAEFKLLGKPRVVWAYDEKALIQRLLGVSLSEGDAVLKEFPGITSLAPSLNPRWVRRLPNKPERITLERVLPLTP